LYLAAVAKTPGLARSREIGQALAAVRQPPAIHVAVLKQRRGKRRRCGHDRRHGRRTARCRVGAGPLVRQHRKRRPRPGRDHSPRSAAGPPRHSGMTTVSGYGPHKRRRSRGKHDVDRELPRGGDCVAATRTEPGHGLTVKYRPRACTRNGCKSTPGVTLPIRCGTRGGRTCSVPAC
jgi:hypothetical protein